MPKVPKATSNDNVGGINAMSYMNRQVPDQGHCQVPNQDKGRPSTPPDFKGITYKGDVQPLGRK